MYKNRVPVFNFVTAGTFVASAREFKILECDVYTEAFMSGQQAA